MMADATAGGDTVTAKATFAPGEAVVERRPSLGLTVLDYPAHSDAVSGGHRAMPGL
jgi:hypothetical protein